MHGPFATIVVTTFVINPRRMREGYGSRVCVSVTALAAT